MPQTKQNVDFLQVRFIIKNICIDLEKILTPNHFKIIEDVIEKSKKYHYEIKKKRNL